MSKNEHRHNVLSRRRTSQWYQLYGDAEDYQDFLRRGKKLPQEVTA